MAPVRRPPAPAPRGPVGGVGRSSASWSSPPSSPSRINLDYYAIQPGTAQSVQPFITVPPAKAHPVTHPVLLTDVREARVTALTYLFFKLQPNTVALLRCPRSPAARRPPSSTPRARSRCPRPRRRPRPSALRHLGYPVPATPAGAVIAGTFAGTPAYGVLERRRRGHRARRDADPDRRGPDRRRSPPYHSGQTVTFTVRKGGTGAPGPGAADPEAHHGRARRRRPSRSTWGSSPRTRSTTPIPFPISIDVTNIGGPSAGLAMTLGVIDTLSGGSLTGGHTVAATGTMDADGQRRRRRRRAPEDGGRRERRGHHLPGAARGVHGAPCRSTGPASRSTPVSTLDQALRVLAANGGPRADRHARSTPAQSLPRDEPLGRRAVVGSPACLRNAG